MILRKSQEWNTRRDCKGDVPIVFDFVHLVELQCGTSVYSMFNDRITTKAIALEDHGRSLAALWWHGRGKIIRMVCLVAPRFAKIQLLTHRPWPLEPKIIQALPAHAHLPQNRLPSVLRKSCSFRIRASCTLSTAGRRNAAAAWATATAVPGSSEC